MRPFIFYDGKKFPQTAHYAACVNAYCVDMRYMLRFKEIQPAHCNYSKIYFAVTEECRPLFEAIIRSHRHFNHEFVDAVPNYAKFDSTAKRIELESKGCKQPFDDLKKYRERKRYADFVVECETKHIMLDPAPTSGDAKRFYAGKPIAPARLKEAEILNNSLKGSKQ